MTSEANPCRHCSRASSASSRHSWKELSLLEVSETSRSDGAPDDPAGTDRRYVSLSPAIRARRPVTDSPSAIGTAPAVPSLGSGSKTSSSGRALSVKGNVASLERLIDTL